MRSHPLLLSVPLVVLTACGAPPAAETSTCPECERCPPAPSCPEPPDGTTEIVARPLRPDGLTSPPGCGVAVFWAETIAEVRRLEPAQAEVPEHLALRLMCPSAMSAECVRVRVPTTRYLDAAAAGVASGFTLQVTEPVAWIACPPAE